MPLAFEVFADDRPWAITPQAIQALTRAAMNPDFQGLVARLGQPVDNGRGVTNYDGVAVLEVRGPLFRYRSFWTWLLGGTAVQDAAVGLRAALEDPGVRAIVLDINSPGGQVDGINEFANQIRAASAVKPVTAYVGGLAGSGAYWLAAAAGRIVADETAQLGSIGVLATVIDDSAASEKRGVKRIEVVSSQSPLKRVDPSTDEGRAQLQTMVDALAQVFIEKVAKFRKTVAAKVERDFGQGGMLPARAAVTIGMADAIGSLETLLGQGGGAPVREMQNRPGLRMAAAMPFDDPESEGDDQDDEDEDDQKKGAAEEPEEEDDKQEKKKPGAVSTAPEGEGELMTPTEERQRIAAILNCEEARGREDLARTLALKTDTTPEAALEILRAAPVAQKPVNAFEARMGQIPNPKIGVPGEEREEDSPKAEINRILAFVPKARQRVQVQ